MIRSILLSCLCFIASVCGAQTDTLFVKRSVADAVKLYEDALKSQTYFDGAAYSELRVTKNEHPYYLSAEWMTGSIDYEGRHFNAIPLRLDLVSHTLVTNSYQDKLLALVNEKLTAFDLNGHQFLRIDNSLTGNSLPATTFYEVLYNGPSQLVIWREKVMQKTLVTQVYTYDLNKNEKLYLEKYRYYVLFDKVYYKVSGKRSMLKLFSSQKHALKEFIRTHNLDFNLDREKSLAAVAACYDKLVKK